MASESRLVIQHAIIGGILWRSNVREPLNPEAVIQQAEDIIASLFHPRNVPAIRRFLQETELDPQ